MHISQHVQIQIFVASFFSLFYFYLVLLIYLFSKQEEAMWGLLIGRLTISGLTQNQNGFVYHLNPGW